MSASDAVFAGSIPDLYDRLMVPLIFEPYAQDLARRAAQRRPSAVLEVAAGTGVVTRALDTALGDARIVATDLNQPMLDFNRAHHADADRVEWRQADALALPFDNRSFDAVLCQFGAMFFPDKRQGYRVGLSRGDIRLGPHGSRRVARATLLTMRVEIRRDTPAS